jgi:hypothetical protein
MAGVIVALLKRWPDNRLPYSPGQMDELCQQLMQSNVEAVLAKKCNRHSSVEARTADCLTTLV